MKATQPPMTAQDYMAKAMREIAAAFERDGRPDLGRMYRLDARDLQENGGFVPRLT